MPPEDGPNENNPMKITIEYCVTCNYRPMAAKIAYEIKQATGEEAELVGGGMGALEVVLDGVLIYSKLRYNRFPKSGEIVKLVEAGPPGRKQ